MEKIFWSDYTTNEIKNIISEEDPLVIITVGATEQHGTHLPLNTDTDLGFNIAQRIAKNSPVKTLILPPVWAGFSPHHMDFSGTITLKQKTLFNVVYDIIESIIQHGISKIIILNSHGGNMSLLKTVVDEVGINHNISPILVTYWHLISSQINAIRKSEMGGMGHACELETSLKMVFSPQDVQEDLMEDVMIPENEFFSVDMFAKNKIGIYQPFKNWSESGQIGAPTLASVETGEKILENIIEQFTELIKLEWVDEDVNEKNN
ncbi:creatininase family protein [Pseudogracilibacillus sp. SE30717A]|uniref:creatininase family protein n=1 Tax=Pseudogracilibacillus sp. SE30717A TaxID=3098293 RepID=UPI00300E4836